MITLGKLNSTDEKIFVNLTKQFLNIEIENTEFSKIINTYGEKIESFIKEHIEDIETAKILEKQRTGKQLTQEEQKKLDNGLEENNKKFHDPRKQYQEDKDDKKEEDKDDKKEEKQDDKGQLFVVQMVDQTGLRERCQLEGIGWAVFKNDDIVVKQRMSFSALVQTRTKMKMNMAKNQTKEIITNQKMLKSQDKNQIWNQKNKKIWTLLKIKTIYLKMKDNMKKSRVNKMC